MAIYIHHKTQQKIFSAGDIKNITDDKKILHNTEKIAIDKINQSIYISDISTGYLILCK